MPPGGKVPPLRPLPPVRRPPGRDAEVGVKDAVLVDAHEKQTMRRRRIVDFMYLGKARRVKLRIVVRVTINGLAQVVAARSPDRQQLPLLRSDPRHIGRTPINLRGFIVRKEQGAPDVIGGLIVGRQTGAPCHRIVPADRRLSRDDIINVPVRQQKTIVVDGIEFRTDLKLSKVAQAGHIPRPGLGPMQSRQQDSQQEDEKRDNDEQFDQRES